MLKNFILYLVRRSLSCGDGSSKRQKGGGVLKMWIDFLYCGGGGGEGVFETGQLSHHLSSRILAALVL